MTETDEFEPCPALVDKQARIEYMGGTKATARYLSGNAAGCWLLLDGRRQFVTWTRIATLSATEQEGDVGR